MVPNAWQAIGWVLSSTRGSPSPGWKYIWDGIVSRFWQLASLPKGRKFDPAYFDDVNAREMLKDYGGDSLGRVNAFWGKLGSWMYKYCNAEDFKKFKTAFNRRFFWLPCNEDDRYLDYYYRKLSARDELGLLSKVHDPDVGNPARHEISGASGITQDLLRSVDEFYGIYPYLKDKESWRICEIGAGYGRLAYVCLQAASILHKQSVHYHIVDIPPAMLVSSKYFSLLPDMNRPPYHIHFYHRDAQAFPDDSKGIHLRFLLPSEFEAGIPKASDVVINISSFEEMAQETVDRYYDLLDRNLTEGGVFYHKRFGQGDPSGTGRKLGTWRRFNYKSHWQEEYSRAVEPPFYFESVYRKGVAACRSENNPPGSLKSDSDSASNKSQPKTGPFMAAEIS